VIRDFQLITVRLRDADGMEGLGYTYTVGQGGIAVRWLVEADLTPMLLGAKADSIEELWSRMWRHLHYVGRGGLASFAISAVDIALWDLHAQRHAKPLWRMLGGTSNQVAVYAGGIDLEFSTAELLQQTERFIAQGFHAVKMKVGRAELSQDLRRVTAMRDALGSDHSLMVDANMAWSVDQAIVAARELKELNVFWLEEPTAPDDFAGHARIVREGGVPIAAGENLHTEREFDMLISSGGVTFAEPDVANIGGITAWLRVASLAERSGLPVTSHGVHDLHVHLLAAVPNASYLEFHGFGLERFMASELHIADGYATAPERIGHGVKLDWKALESFREA